MAATDEFAVAIPVAPGPLEPARVDDLLASLRAYERGLLRVVLVDDEPGARRFDGLRRGDQVAVIPNPRGKRG